MKEGWEVINFKSCLEKTESSTKLPSSSYKKQGDFPIVSQEKEFISGYWNNEEDVFKHETPIIIFGDHTKIVKYIDFDFVIGADGVKILQPKHFLNPKYFYYWVMSVQIPNHGYARHFKYLKEHQVPVPPLSEQQRIVSILDAEFAKIDSLKTNAERNLQNAKDLFQSALKKELEPKKGWKVKRLNEISVQMTDGPFGSNLKKEHYTNNKEVRIIQLSNIGEDGWKDNNIKYTTFEHLKTISRSEVFPNDIVIAKMMPAGRAIICPNYDQKYVLSSDAIKAEINDNFNTKFILYSINSTYFRNQVYENVAGCGRVRTSLTKLKECKLNIPSLSEQQTIVSRLDILNDKCKTLQLNYEKIIALCEDLKQAILRKAFNGEL